MACEKHTKIHLVDKAVSSSIRKKYREGSFEGSGEESRIESSRRNGNCKVADWMNKKPQLFFRLDEIHMERPTFGPGS